MTVHGEESAVQESVVASEESLGEDRSFDYEKARRGVRLLLEVMGEDPDRDGLVETWERRVPSTLATLSQGYSEVEKPSLRTFESANDELVIKSGIPVHSLCEHHLLPYAGTATVGYRPNGHVVGLSKLVRYVRWQSRRLTIQEEFTQDIADGLAAELDSRAVLVDVTATHFCEAMRGVETESETRTMATAGSPTEAERRRFADAIGRMGGSR